MKRRMMRMGKYFSIKELSDSSTAKKLGLDNTPTLEAEENLTRLIENVLDPLREVYGKPIRISSGYRSPKVNQSVNGSTSSQHMKGMAADITVGNKAENQRLYHLIKKLNLPYDQLINEYDFSWVHVSHKKEGNRKQELKIG